MYLDFVLHLFVTNSRKLLTQTVEHNACSEGKLRLTSNSEAHALNSCPMLTNLIQPLWHHNIVWSHLATKHQFFKMSVERRGLFYTLPASMLDLTYDVVKVHTRSGPNLNIHIFQNPIFFTRVFDSKLIPFKI